MGIDWLVVTKYTVHHLVLFFFFFPFIKQSLSQPASSCTSFSVLSPIPLTEEKKAVWCSTVCWVKPQRIVIGSALKCMFLLDLQQIVTLSGYTVVRGWFFCLLVSFSFPFPFLFLFPLLFLLSFSFLLASSVTWMYCLAVLSDSDTRGRYCERSQFLP